MHHEYLNFEIPILEQSIVDAREVASSIDGLTEEVIKKAAIDFEATKLTFIEALNGHIKQKIEPAFKSIEKSQKEIDKAVKVSEMARQGFTLGDLLLVLFVGFSSCLLGLMTFWLIVKQGWW